MEKLIEVYKKRLHLVNPEVEDTKHLLWMMDQMADFKDPLKQHRWLGFVQGVCWSLRLFTIDELRQHVREHTEAVPQPVLWTIDPEFRKECVERGMDHWLPKA